MPILKSNIVTNSVFLFCSTISTAVLLASCGGGGGQSGSTTPIPASPTANQAPQFVNFSTELSHSENANFSLAINAVDADNDPLTYSLSGEDAAAFSITSSGQLTLNSLPDYETQSLYTLLIAVSDGSTTTSASFELTIIDIAETTPTPACSTACEFPGSVVLGRPTDQTISVSLLAETSMQVKIVYGIAPNQYSHETPEYTLQANAPLLIDLNNLGANQKYYYRIQHRSNQQASFESYGEHFFNTQKSKTTHFNFAIHADPHVGIRLRGPHEEEKSDDEMYKKTLANTLAVQPDFMIDLGDTFMAEKNAQRDFYAPDDGIDKTPAIKEWVEEDYVFLRNFFGTVAHSVPLYLVNGNHEGESGWEKTKEDSIAVWANNLRKQYFPVPTANTFYSGSTNEEAHVGTHDGYYSWEWGDALFVVLDPFWYGAVKAKVNSEWEWTLGKEQYDWLNTTLQNSSATFKFIFLHNLVGGQNDSGGLGRGGALVAKDWEWGGMNPYTNTYEFDIHRPGWGKPIHQVLVDNDVNIVFHGHDHVFVTERHPDGIVYQAVPQPSVLNDNDNKALARAAAAGYDTVNGIVKAGSGFLNVVIESEKVSVQYRRTTENALTSEECNLTTCSSTQYAFELNSANSYTEIDPSTVGDNVTNEDENENGNTDGNSEENAGSTTLLLTSPAFKNTGSTHYPLPISFTCDGVNGGVAPSLSWNGVPEGTESIAITMHEAGSLAPNFTLFNISANTVQLHAGDFTSGTAATGDMTDQEISNAGGTPYRAPCTAGSPSTNQYIITLYALSSTLSLDSTTTQAEVKATLADVLLTQKTLTTYRTRYDENAIASNAHVPTAVPSSCNEKSDHFNLYKAVHQSVSCDESNNQLTVISHISDGLKTLEPEQQVQVGINSWIGRLSLMSQAGADIPIRPTFQNTVRNNLSCDGTGKLGVTVDGQLILPYWKQTNDSAAGNTCGPTDGINYANRDTVVMGEVDQCYGHSPNGEGYHLHGAPICLMGVHDPSKPIAYMADGIPLYFGTAGGTVENNPHASSAKKVTSTHYGAGKYSHLDYRPSDVKDGSNPLNECNAYDINNDGDASGYVYYSSKNPPYTIGCFMGEVPTSSQRYSVNRTQLETERNGWLGQTVGQPLDVSITSNTYGEFNGKVYNITEMLVNTSTSFLSEGAQAQVLWRVLASNEAGFVDNKTCFEFRYRANKNDTSNDETEIVCSRTSVPTGTLDFTPFGDLSGSNSTFKLEAWADNWFAAYLGDQLNIGDSVAITTEKSFNAETTEFNATYPLHINVILKDFIENDTGLEYIGTDKQQIGDGGFIAQITDLTTNQVVAVTNSSWKCTTLHSAPLDNICAAETNPIAGQGNCLFNITEEPSNWKSNNFDTSAWYNAYEFSEQAVSPKEGYTEINWSENAEFIWGENLQRDNTLLCKITIAQP